MFMRFVNKSDKLFSLRICELELYFRSFRTLVSAYLWIHTHNLKRKHNYFNKQYLQNI